MLTTRELQKRYPNFFIKFGGIIYNLNKIEIYIIAALSIFFSDDLDAQSEKDFIFNDALFNEKIFPTIENKRRLLVHIIKNVGRVAEENNVDFDKAKWLSVCESIKKLQELRNDIAHNHLVFLNNGRVRYSIRKTNEERISDKKIGNKGTMKMIEFDLDKEFEKSEKILAKSEKLSRFSAEALNILRRKSIYRKLESIQSIFKNIKE